MKALLACRSRGPTGAEPSRLIRTPAADDRERRLDQDRDVEPDRPVLDVVEVEPDEVVEGQGRAPRDLPEARDPGQDEIALPVPGFEPLVVADRERAGPDQAHLAAQHVQELRQLVERELAEQAADAGDAGIAPDLEQRPGRLVPLLEL